MGATCSGGLSSLGVFDIMQHEMPSENSFQGQYKIIGVIGKGNFSTVHLAIHKQTQRNVAVKVIRKAGLGDVDIKALKKEVSIIKSIDHPNIVKCIDFFEEQQFFYMVMEYMEGGDLLDRIIKHGQYSEKDSRDVVISILKAVKFCHDRNIAHRDLKPENILLKSLNNDVDVKIGDFGFAEKEQFFMRTQLGTPEYMAPELVCKRPYTKLVDMWAIGCITYDLLCGFPPFQSKSVEALFRLIRTGSYSFHHQSWKSVSTDAKDFISKLLNVNPTDRMTVDEALAHPWLQSTEYSTFSPSRFSGKESISSFSTLGTDSPGSLQSEALETNKSDNAVSVLEEMEISD